MTHTIPQTRAVLDDEAFKGVKPVLDAFQEVIEAHGDEGIPSGHLYAMVCGKIDLNTYNMVIGLMVKYGGITNKNHLLRAVPR